MKATSRGISARPSRPMLDAYRTARRPSGCPKWLKVVLRSVGQNQLRPFLFLLLAMAFAFSSSTSARTAVATTRPSDTLWRIRETKYAEEISNIDEMLSPPPSSDSLLPLSPPDMTRPAAKPSAHVWMSIARMTPLEEEEELSALPFPSATSFPDDAPPSSPSRVM